MRAVICAALLATSPAVAQDVEDPVVLVVHGGAGAGSRETITPEVQAAYRAGIERALRAGHAALDGGNALDAVQEAIQVLEDDSTFNAGRGAVLAHDGTARHDASIMDGRTGLAGASAGTMHVRHPIALARAVMERSPHVMLAGAGAEEFALSAGLEMVSNQWFVTGSARRSLRSAQTPRQPGAGRGTVGAVALDDQGHLAAGTSTGGMTNKRWDRIGDSPIIGAGTYASDATCGISSTGHGEYFIRLAVAHDIHARVAYLGETCAEAADHVIHTTLTGAGGEGAVITLDAAGRASAPLNTPAMATGTITRSGRVHVTLFADEAR
jgi:beta-aspartyl-peptidase (threonine type)